MFYNLLEDKEIITTKQFVDVDAAAWYSQAAVSYTHLDAYKRQELPYQVNKAQLIEKIAELVQLKKIEGITDLRDESDKDGMRIVIEAVSYTHLSVINS